MTSVQRRHRILLAAAVTASLAVLVSGCSGFTARGNVAAQPAPGGVPVPVASGPSDTPAESAPAGNVPPSGTSHAGLPSCRTGGLRVSLRAVDHATQQTWSLMVFRNTSTHPCTLYGYPGVSFVRGDQGIQTGDPARRTGDPKTVVTLRPGGVAHAELVTIEPLASPGCQPVQVRGFRIYPPNETAAIFLPAPQQACSAPGKSVPSITPVTAGGTG
jgi:hypothetical protein